MDGVGCGSHDEGDAVWLARTPNLDFLAHNALTTTLAAHGRAVGLPSDDDMGNSEVGHNAMGAGRVFDQGAMRINESIASGALFNGSEWKRVTSFARDHGQPLHFIGLLSDGNVHSNIQHLFAMLRGASRDGIEKVRLHILLDGRDVPATSALTYLDALERELASLNLRSDRDYRVASGGGRMKITMDRYNADWSMVERGYRTHVHGQGRAFHSTQAAIATLRDEQKGIDDQNLPPFVIVSDDGLPVGPIRDGAGVILFNFRGDRAIEISRAFDDDSFPYFDRGQRPNVAFAGMMQYDGDLKIPHHYLVSPPTIDRTLGEYLARNNISQFACSETQKYGHVTYFWNGNRGGMFDAANETYLEIPSDTLPFEERPWMKAAEITDATLQNLVTGKYKHARINFPNGDMVGHTGNYESSIVAVEAVDIQIGRIIPVIEKLNGALIVTADHGNADEMFETDKKTHLIVRDASGHARAKTSHTLNRVPFHIYTKAAELKRAPIKTQGLSNIASTVLSLMGYAPPEGYDPSLIE